MSWETLLVGTIRLLDSIDALKKTELLEKLNDLCEENWKLQPDGDYHIESVNWASHVDRDQIEAFFDENKAYFKEYYLDLYYLETPHESWIYGN
jgi:hypothetical protein